MKSGLPSPRGNERSWRAAIAVATALLLVLPPWAAAQGKPTFAVDYIVTISAKNPKLARVRWELAGIDEIEELRLRFRGHPIKKLRASGRLDTDAEGARWIPGGPYGHLSYVVAIDQPRGQSGKFDSYAGSSWIVTRARQLFPKISMTFTPRSTAGARSRSRLIFRLPPGWQSAAPFPRLDSHTYELRDDHSVLVRPRGWLACGDLHLAHEEIADIMVQIASAPGTTVAADRIFEFLNPTLPRLKKLLRAGTQPLLIVSAPDPMWHGGISGAHSFFIHGQRPLRTADKTSPYLHELFHVLQPYKAGTDADWIAEGLAEYYSLELQRRAGLIDAESFARALQSFERYGKWNVDLGTQRDNAATNNSAPLVMYALDQRIQHATSGRMKLDDVVSRLAKEAGVVDSARFRRTVTSVSGKKLTKFFEQHVAKGVPPKLREAP